MFSSHLSHCAATVKATELRTKTKADLVKQLVRRAWREGGLCSAMFVFFVSSVMYGRVLCGAVLLPFGAALLTSNSRMRSSPSFLSLFLRLQDDLKQELGQLRVAKVTGGAASKISKMYVFDRSSARLAVCKACTGCLISNWMVDIDCLCFSFGTEADRCSSLTASHGRCRVACGLPSWAMQPSAHCATVYGALTVPP